MLLIVFAPVAAGVLTMFMPGRWILPRVLVAALGPLTSLATLAHFVFHYGITAQRISAPWMPDLHLDFAFLPDQLGIFFAFLVAGIGFLIILYGRAYLGPDEEAIRRFYPLITLFMTAMLGLVLADDFLLMLVFWEMTSVSSFLLIGWDHDDNRAVKNALQAFITTGFGGLALFGGLVWLGVLTGAWSFSELGEVSASGPMFAAFCLIYAGAAAKSAQWPLHYWLPGAMMAPTPISAYLHSAAMVKAGIYLLARIWPEMSGLHLWPIMVIGIGGFTMVLGAWIALQRDVLKQILAYTTISQLGLLAAAFGLAAWEYQGQRNIVWGNAQVLNHAVYKAALFMLAGGVAHAFGKAKLSELTGAWHTKPERLYAILFLLGMAGLAALPGTFSFFAKEAFLYGIWHAIEESGRWPLWLLLIAAVLTSVFNVAILVRFAWSFFSRPIDLTQESQAQLARHGEAASHHHDEQAHHDSWFWTFMLWFPAAVLIGAQFFGGLAGPLAARLLLPYEATPNYWEPYQISLWYAVTHPGGPLLLSAIGIVLGLLLGISPLMRRIREDWHDRLFPMAYEGILRGGGFIFGTLQNGRLRWYLSATGLSLVLIIAWIGYIDWRAEDLIWPTDLAMPMFFDFPSAWLLCGLVCLGAVVMVLVRDRVTRVLVLGIVGFSVTGVFYVFAAPDLALTQLSIEIVSLILFLLVLDLLPRARTGDRTLVPLRLSVALIVGATAFAVTVWASTGPRPERPPLLADGSRPEALGEYFLRNSYGGRDTAMVRRDLTGRGVVDRGTDHLYSFGSKPPETLVHDLAGTEEFMVVHKGGGGANVVNVILVDFRGFDTLGEIVVLALAAMGVWTLLRKPAGPGGGAFQTGDAQEVGTFTGPLEDTFIDPYALPGAPPPILPRGRSPIHSELIASTILRNAVRVLIPLAMVFGVYLFFKGHQSPGGGFVAGLTTAVAMLVYRMCFGATALKGLLPVRERTLIGLGLLFAAAAAAVPLLFGLPLLTSNNGYLPLPGGMSFHWATVMVFDLGVFLVVVGSVVGMVDAIARELE